MRRPLVIADWKMHTTLAEAVVLATTIRNNVGGLDVQVVLCPPFVWLYPIAEVFEKSPHNLKLGSQDVFYKDEGAYTGEISPLMINKMCRYAVVGHSERRRYFGETDEAVNQKVLACLRHDIRPILCVGELKKLDELSRRGRPSASDQQWNIFRQLSVGLDGVSRQKISEVVIAYEPVWAIGSGHNASAVYSVEVIANLRDRLSIMYSRDLANQAQILYGGSVSSSNIAEYTKQPEIDGVLVGGASLKAKEFLEICREVAG